LSLSRILRAILWQKKYNIRESIGSRKYFLLLRYVTPLSKCLSEFKETGILVSYADPIPRWILCSKYAIPFSLSDWGCLYDRFASVGVFYSGLSDKLGVEYNIFKVGTFKGAVEPYYLKNQ
jgi:protease-4